MTNQQVDNETHRHRRSIRLAHRDYLFPGTYFVTICAHERQAIFGRMQEARLIPSDLGRLVRECWVAIPLHFPHVKLHEFVVMPNHLHGLIAIARRESAPPVTSAAPSAIASAVNKLTPTMPPPLVGAQHWAPFRLAVLARRR